METVPGPCNDVDCERIPVGVVEVAQVPDQSYRIYAGDGYFLAIEPPVQMYIDNGHYRPESENYTNKIDRNAKGSVEKYGHIWPGGPEAD